MMLLCAALLWGVGVWTQTRCWGWWRWCWQRGVGRGGSSSRAEGRRTKQSATMTQVGYCLPSALFPFLSAQFTAVRCRPIVG